MTRAPARTTLVVVPRERWSYAVRSLDSVLATTEPPFHLVYVDGGSPEPVRSELAKRLALRGFDYIRRERVLAPNEARNLGAADVDSEYLVFVDNDVVVERGWLDRLVAGADETGAWAVGPLLCIGWPPGRVVHSAGGAAHVENGAMVDEHYAYEADRFATNLRRKRVEQVEFHCMLVRTDEYRKLGPFDEKLLSLGEHTDFCMLVAAAGGTVVFEPASVVTQVLSKWLTRSDLPFHRQRWSDDWSRRSVEHFAAKWKLRPDDPWCARLYEWTAVHRVRIDLPSKLLRLAFGPERGYRIACELDRLLRPGPVRFQGDNQRA